MLYRYTGGRTTAWQQNIKSQVRRQEYLGVAHEIMELMETEFPYVTIFLNWFLTVRASCRHQVLKVGLLHSAISWAGHLDGSVVLGIGAVCNSSSE